MGREMRLVDAVSLTEKLSPLLAIAEKRKDARSVAALSYVLDLIEEEPTLILKAESPKKKAPVRHKHGRYRNVLLSEEEMEKVREEFPGDYEERIEALSEYIEMKGDKYKSHLAVLRSWDRRDKKNKPKGESSFDAEDFFRAALEAAEG